MPINDLPSDAQLNKIVNEIIAVHKIIAEYLKIKNEKPKL